MEKIHHSPNKTSIIFTNVFYNIKNKCISCLTKMIEIENLGISEIIQRLFLIIFLIFAIIISIASFYCSYNQLTYYNTPCNYDCAVHEGWLTHTTIIKTFDVFNVETVYDYTYNKHLYTCHHTFKTENYTKAKQITNSNVVKWAEFYVEKNTSNICVFDTYCCENKELTTTSEMVFTLMRMGIILCTLMPILCLCYFWLNRLKYNNIDKIYESNSSNEKQIGIVDIIIVCQIVGIAIIIIVPILNINIFAQYIILHSVQTNILRFEWINNLIFFLAKIKMLEYENIQIIKN